MVQQERRKGQSRQRWSFFFDLRYCFPESDSTPSRAISSMHGGVFDLHPCLFSQPMQ